MVDVTCLVSKYVSRASSAARANNSAMDVVIHLFKHQHVQALSSVVIINNFVMAAVTGHGNKPVLMVLFAVYINSFVMVDAIHPIEKYVPMVSYALGVNNFVTVNVIHQVNKLVTIGEVCKRL